MLVAMKSLSGMAGVGCDPRILAWYSQLQGGCVVVVHPARQALREGGVVGVVEGLAPKERCLPPPGCLGGRWFWGRAM